VRIAKWKAAQVRHLVLKLSSQRYSVASGFLVVHRSLYYQGGHVESMHDCQAWQSRLQTL
jgi:hypothetical protein